MSIITRKRAWRALLVLGTPAIIAAVVGHGLATARTASAAEGETAALYVVAQEGLTAPQSQRLADTFAIKNALQSNGAFSYVDKKRLAKVPTKTLEQGRDEEGRATIAQALNLAAIKRLKPLSDERALAGAAKLLEVAGLSPELEARPQVSHSELTLTDREGRVTLARKLDTSVSYGLTLGGLPADGQGAKLRITFDSLGNVTQLSHALRQLKRSGDVRIISGDEAVEGCAALYPADTKQQAPTLGYYLPPLGAEGGSGRGQVEVIFPQYKCNPVAEQGDVSHRLLPAVPGSAPHAKLTATLRSDAVSAEVSVDGGTPPYTYGWSSSTTVLDSDDRSESINYRRSARDKRAPEVVTLEITDANGLSATASVSVPGDGTQSAESVPGGGGFGALAVGPTDVGIEQTVDEWQCAQDSAIGFKSVMAAHGIGTAFDWRGWSAFEKDFKSDHLGGWDDTYVDNVDAQWYTGHGSPGGFTFKSSVDDTSIVPADARWGNRDLEWLQLESCQVLADTNGTHDYFGRWGPALDGLHILNGFHTNAYCVAGGTGGTFASYLFPRKILFWTIPALTVRQAWAQMALDKEPSNVVYRSMGPIGPGWVTNINDYFWGQGAVGPDITAATKIGHWSITGTV